MSGIVHAMRMLIMMLLMCALFSCHHKDLLTIEDTPKARIRINVDWTDFMDKETPSGMSVIAYPVDGSKPFSALTNDISYAEMLLPAGMYNLMVYNQSPSEFGSITFSDMDNFYAASIHAVTVSTRWYKSRADDERVVTQPEWFGVDRIENVEVTQKMVDRTSEMKRLSGVDKKDYTTIISNLYPQNIISTINVRVHIKGAHNLRSARASLTGLAEGWLLGKYCPTTETVTQLLEQWTLTLDSSDPTQGYITAKITSFGLPDAHSYNPTENLFTLQLLLVDGKTMLELSFHVGDKLKKRKDLGRDLWLELRLDETLPDVEPSGGSSSGFDAVVNDWGDEEDVKVNI